MVERNAQPHDGVRVAESTILGQHNPREEPDTLAGMSRSVWGFPAMEIPTAINSMSLDCATLLFACWKQRKSVRIRSYGMLASWSVDQYRADP